MREPRNSVSRWISMPFERLSLSHETFSNFQSVFLRRRESASLSSFFCYLSASRRYIAESRYIIFPAGTPLDLSAWHSTFQTALAIATAAVFPSRRLSSIRLLRKNEVVGPKWISQRAFTGNRELTPAVGRYNCVVLKHFILLRQKISYLVNENFFVQKYRPTFQLKSFIQTQSTRNFKFRE